MWAKCDMLSTVSLARLDRVKTGKRRYVTFDLPGADFEAIRDCVRIALGL